MRASCSCGWKGVVRTGDADSAHGAALADRAGHVTGALVVPLATGVPVTDHPVHDDRLPLAG